MRATIAIILLIVALCHGKESEQRSQKVEYERFVLVNVTSNILIEKKYTKTLNMLCYCTPIAWDGSDKGFLYSLTLTEEKKRPATYDIFVGCEISNGPSWSTFLSEFERMFNPLYKSVFIPLTETRQEEEKKS